jgi:signal transduction histidine kinase
VFFAASILLVFATYLLLRRTLIAGYLRMNVLDLKGMSDLPPNKIMGFADDGTPITFADLQSRFTDQQHQALNASTNSLVVISLVIVIASGLLAVAVGWMMAGRVIRPLQRISRTAEVIAAGNLRRRIRMSGPADELKRLADTFDDMLDRLDSAFEGQRRFVGNASHELRTPLAVSRTLIQVAMGRDSSSADLRELGCVLLDINTQQVRLTDALLTLARSDQGIPDARLVDLVTVVHGVLDRTKELAAAKGVEVVVGTQTAFVSGDPVLLSQLVNNLVRNAVVYNSAGGRAAIELSASADRVQLVVSNTGPLVDADSVAGLFEPFRRLGSPRTAGDGSDGVGLGLSIVESIARAHRGQVTAVSRSGGGLTVTVTLPVAPIESSS